MAMVGCPEFADSAQILQNCSATGPVIERVADNLVTSSGVRYCAILKRTSVATEAELSPGRGCRDDSGQAR